MHVNYFTQFKKKYIFIKYNTYHFSAEVTIHCNPASRRQDVWIMIEHVLRNSDI